MSNLRLINDTTFSDVTNASVTDVFSSDYDIYKVVATDNDTTSNHKTNWQVSEIIEKHLERKVDKPEYEESIINKANKFDVEMSYR